MSNANSNDVSAQILPPCKNPHLCSCGTNFCHALSSTQKTHQREEYIFCKSSLDNPDTNLSVNLDLEMGKAANQLGLRFHEL